MAAAVVVVMMEVVAMMEVVVMMEVVAAAADRDDVLEDGVDLFQLQPIRLGILDVLSRHLVTGLVRWVTHHNHHHHLHHRHHNCCYYFYSSFSYCYYHYCHY